MNTRLFNFVGGESGAWRVVSHKTLLGEAILEVSMLDIIQAEEIPNKANSGWVLRGVTSNERYVQKAEKAALLATQQGLGRSEATLAALIPIRKNAAWWALSQEERRAILEEQSHHIQIGLRYLPAIARRLHHCRDLAMPEPFDFLTWFEFAPEHEADFDSLLTELRTSAEWQFVDREIDLRLVRDKS